MNEVDAPLGHVNRYLPQQPVDFQDLLAELEARDHGAGARSLQ